MNFLVKSFAFALHGFLVALKEQRNLRIHLFISALVLAVAYLLEINFLEFSILLLCMGLVISLELVNSSIEGLVDLISPEKKALAGKIKDISAAAVLVAAVTASLVGIIIFGSHLC